MRPQTRQVLHRVRRRRLLRRNSASTLRLVTAVSGRRGPQNDIVLVGLLLVPGLGVDLGEAVLVLVNLLQDAGLGVAGQTARLVCFLVGLADLEGGDVVWVLGAALNDHRIVAILDLSYLLLVGAQDHVFLRVLLQVLVALLHAPSQVQVVVGLAGGALLWVAALVVRETAALDRNLGALGAVRNLLLVAYRSILRISIICS